MKIYLFYFVFVTFFPKNKENSIQRVKLPPITTSLTTQR